jgi:hypothetical protein
VADADVHRLRHDAFWQRAAPEVTGVTLVTSEGAERRLFLCSGFS